MQVQVSSILYAKVKKTCLVTIGYSVQTVTNYFQQSKANLTEIYKKNIYFRRTTATHPTVSLCHSKMNPKSPQGIDQ